MSTAEPVVTVIDDDAPFRRSTERLIQSAGFQVRTFGAAADFLKSNYPDSPACLVLDVRMPGMSGLDLQKEFARTGIEIPIIFVTGHGDIPMSVQAMKAGAVEFLTKPFREQDLLDAIQEAIQRDIARRKRLSRVEEVRQRYEALTPREREVMTYVVSGKLNKQIAAELGTTEKTIKFHRGHLMQKMRVDSVATLVQIASLLDKASTFGAN